ncbi:MAG: hypothetical protein ACREYE_33815, partial [Gammaproteobacteria bacterium]
MRSSINGASDQYFDLICSMVVASCTTTLKHDSKNASSAEFVGTDLRRIYASDSLLGIKLRSIGPKFWVSKNLLG